MFPCWLVKGWETPDDRTTVFLPSYHFRVVQCDKSVKSPTSQSKEEATSQDDKIMRLPALPKFSDDDSYDSNAFDRWVQKLDKYAELEGWTDGQKLLQFELHLCGKAERVYEVLPTVRKGKCETAIRALKQWCSQGRAW